MTIDIRGISPVNRGAQLMMMAIVDRLGGTRSLSSNPWQGAFDTRARLGLRQTLHHYRFRRTSTRVGNLVPAKAADKFGLARDRDITGVLDASGFAYSDSFSLDRHEREAFFGRRWASRNVPKVMLPQAFGPFTDPKKAALAKEILDQATIVFARDDVSMRHLHDLGVQSKIERSVDFTIGLHPRSTERVVSEPFAAIVPNTKVISSGLMTTGDYVELLRAYIRASRANGLEGVLVVHEESDRSLAHGIATAEEATVFEHDDPLILKGVLGQSELVVASRFHAAVGALAQGVPSVVLGWSHKYEELLQDFGAPQWIARPADAAAAAVDRVLGDASVVATVRSKRAPMLDRVESMWQRTERALP